jgi:transcriptional regulator of arginine metabolism
MNKASRLALIERLVRENVIGSQEELLTMMEGTGMKCTQATLSRDLRQIGISRGFDGSGGYRYLLPGGKEGAEEALPGSATAAITAMTWARGLLLISTAPGFASAVAIRIDRAGRYEIAGTVAGDDTILLIPRDNISTEAIEECLKSIFKTDIK